MFSAETNMKHAHFKFPLHQIKPLQTELDNVQLPVQGKFEIECELM